MDRIAVMGDYDSICGFGMLGLETVFGEEPQEAEKWLRTLVSGGCRVIFITEALAAKMEKVLEEYREQTYPSVILIPGTAGNTGAGIQGIRDSVERAVGADILFGEGPGVGEKKEEPPGNPAEG